MRDGSINSRVVPLVVCRSLPAQHGGGGRAEGGQVGTGRAEERNGRAGGRYRKEREERAVGGRTSLRLSEFHARIYE